MHDTPSISELIDAVQRYLNDVARPGLTGHAAFSALVASNVLAIVKREVEFGPEQRFDEKTRLVSILNADSNSTLQDLNVQLCEKLRTGELTADTPGLFDHLKTTTISQLAVDQPKYSGLTATED
ncbi:MAG: DUF6285 domain-containing protein [Hyphomonas sp.]